MPRKEARVSKYIEVDIDGPIKPPLREFMGPHPPVKHKIKRRPVGLPVPPPEKAPVQVGDGSCCGCVIM